MMKKMLLLLLFGSFVNGSTHPYQVVVFRHTEKFIAIKDLDAPLNGMGQRRAAYLVDFFLGGKKPIIDQEDHEIAAVIVPNPHGPSYDYVRPTQTIIPLFHEAEAYRVERRGKGVELIDHHYYTDADKVFSSLMHEPRFEGKTIIICWEYLNLPSLFEGLPSAVKKNLHHLGENRFDMVWVIRWEEGVPQGQTLYQKAHL